MNWNININQKAIVKLNQGLEIPLDLKDATILEWMLKFHAEPKAKKIIKDESLYFWAAYALIIRENPLLEIDNKQSLSRRIDKLIDAGLLYKHIEETKGNRTYFSITQKCFNRITRDSEGVLTEKSIGIDSKVNRVLTEKSNNNNIIDNIYIIIREKLSSNIFLLENTQRNHKLNSKEVADKIDEFSRYCQSIQKNHNNDSETFSHFTHWMNTNAATPVKKDIEKQLKWFLEMFNDISRGSYKPTELIRSLFTKKLNEGFTGPEMATAVKNMYSNSDKNDWHKRTGYVNATPEFLLKNDNLNKYLNQRF